MKMRSPVAAMLWENWRLTRVEAAQRTGLGIVAGSAAMVLFDAGATAAFWVLIVLHGMCVWLSTLKLNGGRFMDGYKPGFPFYLLYTRPVPTTMFVGVAVAYDAVSCAALYLVSAALLGFVFGQPLPLFSVAVWIVVFHVLYMCIQWSTPSRVVQWIGSMAFALPMFLLLKAHVASPLQVEFSLLDNALMVLAGVVSFGLTVAGVARQRRGDAIASVPRKAGSAGYPDWLVTLFRFRCPTSSATKAQLWFELKSSGLPVLAIGLATAMLIFLLFVISIAVAPLRLAAIPVAMFSAPVVLFFLGSNAFGIRRKQGRTYASSFEATQPYGTAQLAGLKVLVRSGCLLAALVAVGMSAWASSSLVSAWGTWVDGKQEPILGILVLRHWIGSTIGGLTGYTFAAPAVVLSITVAITVAGFAALEALRARFPRRLLVAVSLLLLWGLALVLLAWAAQHGIVPASLVDAIIRATRWIAAAALVFTTIYLLWSGFAERALTIRYVCGALVISVAFGAAWVAMLQAAGVQLAGMPATNDALILALPLLPLMASALVPWSLGRIRHM